MKQSSTGEDDEAGREEVGSRDRSHGNRGVRFWDPDSIGDNEDDPRSKIVLDAPPYVKA